MSRASHKISRLSRSADIGRLVAEGRRRAKLSQEEFASKLGISRKTVSDLERGVAHHVSLQTALQALALAGFVLEASLRRPPTLSEVMAQRAEHQARVDRLTEATATPPGRGSSPSKRSRQ
jgi:transcriptional regulator with XRE-family HTH domain